MGAGGIGCAVGYALCAAGVQPVLVDANPRKIHWGRRHGIRIDRRPALPARFEAFADWQPEPGATVLLCTKCYDNNAVLSRLAEPATLIPIQNGFDPRLGGNHGGIEGIASFISECYPDRTHTRLTRRGSLHLGGRALAPSEGNGNGAAGAIDRTLLRKLATLLRVRAPFDVFVVENILPYKYTKLMYNAAINPLAALTGLDNGELVMLPKVRHWFFALLKENYGILTANAIPLGKIGLFHPATVQRILSHSALARLFAWLFYPTLRGSYCSMSLDLPRGQTEIEFFNRHLIDLAGDFPCPINRRVYALVKRMEGDRTPPGTHVLDDLGRPPP